MSSAVRTQPRPSRPTIILWAIAAAWAVALAAEISGRGSALHHDALVEGGLPLWASLAVFLMAWQVMIAAMMLPSSLPFITLFNRTAAAQPRAGLVQASLAAGYLAMWTAFGALAFAGDIVLHRTVDAWPWLADRPWIIGGAVLIVAGAFQFSDLKERCLRECRHPGAYLLKHYRRGAGAAFRLGRGHGLFCLGCCWALMLVMFAAGVANLAWMAGLTLLTVFEKTGKGGERAVAPIGLGLMILGLLVLAHPGWMPSLFAAR